MDLRVQIHRTYDERLITEQMVTIGAVPVVVGFVIPAIADTKRDQMYRVTLTPPGRRIMVTQRLAEIIGLPPGTLLQIVED